MKPREPLFLPKNSYVEANETFRLGYLEYLIAWTQSEMRLYTWPHFHFTILYWIFWI